MFDVYRTRFGRLLTAAADRRSALRVSDDVQSRWRAFSRTGVPGDDWPAYTSADRAVKVFDRRPRVEYDPHADRRQAWEGFSLADRLKPSSSKSAARPRRGCDCVIGVAYPLDPLSGDEFTAVASILQREHGVGDGWRFASIELVEPGKAELRAFDDGGPPPPRRAEVICLQRANNATYKGVVSLTDDRVESFEHIPGVQANFTVDEFVECDQLLRKHPDVIAALAKRGITDMDLVFIDTWTYGDAVAPPEYRDRRIGWSDTWLKDGPGAEPVRPSGQRAALRRSTSTRWSCCGSRTAARFPGGVEPPDVMGEYVPKPHPGAHPRGVAARAAQAAAHHPAGRTVVHARRQPAAIGRTGRCASASTTARE